MHGVLVPRPSARAHLPGVPEPGLAADGRLRSGHVVGYTVNQHQWHPDFDPPYVIAVVALAEDPTVRLTTMIVGSDPAEVAIGQAR